MMQSGYDGGRKVAPRIKPAAMPPMSRMDSRPDVIASEMNPPKGINTTYVTIPVINSETVGVTMISSD